MDKSDISAVAVFVVFCLAALVVMAKFRRLPRAPRPVSTPGADPDGVALVSADDVAPTVAAPSRALTARERRHEELRVLVQSGDRCLYCASPAEFTLPQPRFERPSVDFSALLTGDLPRHWRVEPPVQGESTPMVCASHAQIARGVVELRIARAHAEYVEFVARQREEIHEFARHGLDEGMRAEADRVRKGAARGGGL